MSQCSCQDESTFKLKESTTNKNTLISYLMEKIKSEVFDPSENSRASYQDYAAAFDPEAAFDDFYGDKIVLEDLLQVEVEDSIVTITGNPTLNSDNHASRWAAWVLFDKFGEGDELSIYSTTTWSDSEYLTCIRLNRIGRERVKISSRELP